MPTLSRYALGIDVGGTFTDVVLIDRETGKLWMTKTPSTPLDPSEGFLHGVRKILQQSGLRSEDLSHVFHGTTVATNTILEGKGAKTGVLTTEGFKYVLEIGRHDVPRKANLYSWIKPHRPVSPEWVLEVSERIDQNGAELVALDEHRCQEVANVFRQAGIDSLAVCFIHAYANPAHEEHARTLIAKQHPEAFVSLSSEVLPVFREYERTMATVLNAYVRPVVSGYLGKLERRLATEHVHAPLLIMKSNGGVFGAETAAVQSAHIALSGPAAGVIAAQYVGKQAGIANLMSIDIGGTSADVCLIHQGRAEITTEGEIGPFPLQIPMVAVHTIGAGGGSIASVNRLGNLTVGPRSAGADPGPACYGRGGEEPTVTDANLVLGRIPSSLLGGEIALDEQRAREAIEKYVARPLGLDLFAAAEGVLKIVHNNMAGALRVVSIERGYDPRDFALIAFGGAGPLHAGPLAQLLGIPTVIIPPQPGALSALGLLVTDLANDYVQTCLQRGPHYDLKTLAHVYARLETEAARWLEKEGIPPSQRAFRWAADLRYARQGVELTAETASRAVTPQMIQELVSAFHRKHEQLYTYALEETPVEIVNVRVQAVGLLNPSALPRVMASEGTAPTPFSYRPVYFAEAGGFVTTPCYRRGELCAGQMLSGPAIVEQLDTTTVIFPGQQTQVDGFGNLLVT
jgi:N-methylhydantoinase A